MLPFELFHLRLFLHVLGATIWVGGQLTLAALVPTLRAAGTEIPAVAARAYNRIAWPAFALLIGTGVWNIIDMRSINHGAWATTFNVKMVVVAISGISAFAHTRARSTAGLAIFGALTGLSALGALLLGILLAG